MYAQFFPCGAAVLTGFEKLSPTAGSTDAESLPDLPLNLQGPRLLYVGGRLTQVHRLRAFVEEVQAELLHHDGGLEERQGLLAGLMTHGHYDVELT